MPHTKGPWVTIQNTDSLGDKCRYIVAADGTHVMGDERYYPWCPYEESDWHLIAAAPELLEALKGLLELGGDDDRRIKAEAAVAKAEGRSN